MTVELPTERTPGRPFDPPADLSRLTADAPLTPLRFPDGHEGWLATGYTAVRRVLADPRFSNRSELQHSPLPEHAGMTAPPAQPGDFLKMDPPDHTRYRKLLAGKFTTRRMAQLTERIELIATEHLDAMQRHGGPIDLVAAYALPIPAMVICELLGVPYSDRDRFQADAAKLFGPNTTPVGKYEAFEALSSFVRELITAKRADPTDDVLSELTTSDLTDDELAAMGGLLLAAGLDTTANMIALGTFALLRHPEQWATLRTDPDSVGPTVEELMRFLSIVPTLARVALEDVEFDGHLIKSGSTVVLAMAAANRDATKFPDPNALDLRRDAVGHIGFGHGPHLCLGHQLARVEMRVAFPALAKRFPSLRLAVPADDVVLREGADIYGVTTLPVTW
ncbi:cytochrome P450 [Umezawaea endophytica]|uniref:Cytochrome P450 n=1 Tax=Umezawaea endophytica TaxID=1654476 RepID=A0A9X2VTE4_9PSEU|nr:cytochrome P450 [Umezawaea endophytica]MCS7482420.1 cytochrome P450 [Umezawaea endophytica]